MLKATILSSLLLPGILAAQSAYRPYPELPANADVVFAGVENPIVVNLPGIKSQNLQLIPSFGEIRRDTGNRFLWKICHLDSNRAVLNIRDVTQNRLLDTVVFRAKMIPPPEFIAHLNWEGGIVPALKNFQIDVKCELISYEASYYPLNSGTTTSITLSNKGAMFSPSIREVINIAKPGGKLTFSKFYFKCGCDETVRRSPESLVFIAK